MKRKTNTYGYFVGRKRESRQGGFYNPVTGKWSNWKLLSEEDKEYEKEDKRTEQEKLLDKKIVLRERNRKTKRNIPFHG